MLQKRSLWARIVPIGGVLTVVLSSALALAPIRVGGNVAQANRISMAYPVYPAEAKENRVQGTVTLEILIAEDGRVVQAKPLSGPPELIQSAMDAVLQWTYRPTLLNGQEVQVITTVDINYTLSQ